MYLPISQESRDSKLIEAGYLCVVAAFKTKKDASAIAQTSKWKVGVVKEPTRKYEVAAADGLSFTHVYLIPPTGVKAENEVKLRCFPSAQHYKAFEAMQQALCVDEPEINYVEKKLGVSIDKAKELVKDVDALLGV